MVSSESNCDINGYVELGNLFTLECGNLLQNARAYKLYGRYTLYKGVSYKPNINIRKFLLNVRRNKKWAI